MAMNNWGGVTEHMFVKPRKLFRNRNHYPRNQRKEKGAFQINEVKIRKKRRLYLWRIILVYIGILIAVLWWVFTWI